ncbi:O-antigen ligase family protein, partial [Candidatus Parcubacteria bacterium]|nr:O-antigen ligase family protein [Candidatus Parcubacteria bacterium]
MEIKAVLKWLIIAGIFLIPWIPFLVAKNLYFPFITEKNFTFRIIIEIVFALWAILALQDKEYRPKRSFIFWAIAIFVIVLTVADVFSENPYKSFWSNYERMEGLITIIHLFLYFIVMATVLRTEKMWSWLIHTSVASSIIMAIYGFYQIAGKVFINQGGVRVDGRFGNATYLAIYMLFHVFLTALLAVRARGSWKWLYSIPIFMQLTIISYTETRGTILGLVIGAIVTTILIAIFEKGNWVARRSAIGILIGLLVLSVGFVMFKNSKFLMENRITRRLAHISVAEGNPRFMVWGMALKGFKERPILGWGQESFNYVFNKYYDPGMYNQEQWFDRTHNVFFDWLIAGGILGLLSYLLIFAAVLYYIWRRNGNALSVTERSIVTGMLVGYFIHNFFVFDNLVSYILFFTVLAYVQRANAERSLAVSIKQQPMLQTFQPFNFSPELVNRILAPVIVVLAIFVVYYFNLKPIFAGENLIEAIRLHTVNGASDPEANLDYFKKGFSYNSFGSTEAREQLVQASQMVYRANVDNKIKEDFFNLAYSEMQNQLKRTPNDARYQLFMGAFLDGVGMYDKALPFLLKAHELSPTKQTIDFEVGSNYLSQGQFDNAYNILKEAYDRNHAFQDALAIYATAAIYDKRFDEASKVLTEAFGTDLVNDDRIIRAYQFAGKFDKIQKIFEARIAQNPNDYNSYPPLAGAYLQLGQPAKAIAA